MGKPTRPRSLADTEAKAVLRGLRTSPRKLNLVAQLIRGRKVGDALAQLKFCHRRIAGAVKKALESAVANAETNHELDVDRLVVKEATVGRALVMRRFKARARGRGARIDKPLSHLTVRVAERPAPAGETAGGEGRARRPRSAKPGQPVRAKKAGSARRPGPARGAK